MTGHSESEATGRAVPGEYPERDINDDCQSKDTPDDCQRKNKTVGVNLESQERNGNTDCNPAYLV